MTLSTRPEMTRTLLDREWSGGTAGDVPAIVEQVADVVAAAGMPAERVLRVELAVEEAAVNVCKHGYDNELGWLRVRVWRDNGEITVELSDRAAEFDPLSQDPPDLTSDLNHRAVGGMGIHLIRSVCDRVEYAREGHHNILSMVFEIAPSA